MAKMIKKLYTDDSISSFLSQSKNWKNRSIALSDLFLADPTGQLTPRGVKMADCGHWLTFDLDPAGQAGYHLTRSNYCRQRLCPTCQWRRSRLIFAHLTDVWDALRADGYEVLHVVLTVRNVKGSKLSDEITRMYKAFSRLIKHSALSGWKGALRFLEVSYNACTKCYHPHLHVLVAVRPSYFKSRYYVSHDLLVMLWRAALGVPYDPVCYLTKCDPAAILEVSKYCVKPFDFAQIDPADTLGIYRHFDMVLHGRRLIQSYGVLRDTIRKCNLDDSLDDEPDRVYDLDDLVAQHGLVRSHLVYCYRPEYGRYELDENC